MKYEEQFYKQLREAPELPDSIFYEIDKKISRGKGAKRILLSVAAALVLSIGTLGLALQQTKVAKVDEAVAMELNEIWDYVNGYDINQDLETFAILDNY